jgi:hypothetical protein
MSTAMTVAPPNYGLTAAEVASLDSAISDFTTGLTEHTTAQANARAKTLAKEGLRTALENVIRELRDKAKANKTSDSLMADLGLPAGAAAAPPNATQPIGEVDTSERMRHTISFSDKAADGNKRRPRGAVGCEIWVKIGSPEPASEKDCTFLGLDTQTPYVVDYTAEDVNKTAYYMLRWQMRDGSKSSWGETISATITA